MSNWESAFAFAHALIALRQCALCARDLRGNRNSFHSCFYSAGVWFRLRRNNTCALLGFFRMKNPSLCCKVAFGLRVTLLKSGLACHRQAKP
jgi:hypothetical protein